MFLLFLSSSDNLTPHPRKIDPAVTKEHVKIHVMESVFSKSSTWTGVPCCTFDAGGEDGALN
jgi:hypothetical protein